MTMMNEKALAGELMTRLPCGTAIHTTTSSPAWLLRFKRFWSYRWFLDSQKATIVPATDNSVPFRLTRAQEDVHDAMKRHLRDNDNTTATTGGRGGLNMNIPHFVEHDPNDPDWPKKNMEKAVEFFLANEAASAAEEAVTGERHVPEPPEKYGEYFDSSEFRGLLAIARERYRRMDDNNATASGRGD